MMSILYATLKIKLKVKLNKEKMTLYQREQN